MTPEETVRTYFDSWNAKDFDRLQQILADDVTFQGPLGQANGAQECRKGIEGLSAIVTDAKVRHRFVDGPDVLTWFELHTTQAPPLQTANWSHVVDGEVTRI
ncbi:nuclear transport factor 2 family protein [Actinokineospora terrae]|uniref:SnoaL-like domain-containing protein n=1 Tax=Actinokineospora terrae TaxID=155974 RepID=A0A1H9XPK4_9PSEU|nr:nuclear transport factor 2 family protein [Actinokineospora terrae]SES47633.1 SnoaL-like domain-containing protein [Actinokineospora terrae]